MIGKHAISYRLAIHGTLVSMVCGGSVLSSGGVGSFVGCNVGDILWHAYRWHLQYPIRVPMGAAQAGGEAAGRPVSHGALAGMGGANWWVHLWRRKLTAGAGIVGGEQSAEHTGFSVSYGE